MASRDYQTRAREKKEGGATERERERKGGQRIRRNYSVNNSNRVQ